ncbi:hypothetical protein [Bifidobacterium biavatii]|uniref:Uncharacterized protein n=1 Tax=Bifidobacterium biavatii DSM 23969 TaxID=1437608 RepID=A0A086ZYX1_9BIFI|nr:hypothetical protein [Bifidobacterium biavatii]KFI51721.1 hypothetical protein BBIA_0635 [Bifidobacterium biavatii DSM 23969]
MTPSMPSTMQALDQLNTSQAPAVSDEQRRQLLLERQAMRIKDLQETVKRCEEEIDQLKTQILDAYPIGDYQAGPLCVKVKAGANRLNTAKLTAAFPADKYPQLYESKLSTKQVRSQFAPTALADYMTIGTPQVMVA